MTMNWAIPAWLSTIKWIWRKTKCPSLTLKIQNNSDFVPLFHSSSYSVSPKDSVFTSLHIYLIKNQNERKSLHYSERRFIGTTGPSVFWGVRKPSSGFLENVCSLVGNGDGEKTIILRPLELSLGRERGGSTWEDQRWCRKGGESSTARSREQIHRACVDLTMTFLIPETKPATESNSIHGETRLSDCLRHS